MAMADSLMMSIENWLCLGIDAYQPGLCFVIVRRRIRPCPPLQSMWPIVAQGPDA